MSFGLLGDLIIGGAELAGQTLYEAHSVANKTLDATGLAAFVPPAGRRLSDDIVYTVRDGVKVFGYGTGNILRSWDQQASQRRGGASRGSVSNPNDEIALGNELCPICQEDPTVGDFPTCSKTCGDIYDAREAKRRNRESNKVQ